MAEVAKDGGSNRLSRSPASDFTYNTTYEQAVELASKGWAEGSAEARSQQINLRSLLTKPGKRSEWRRVVAGGNLLINSYIQGKPDCYLRKRVVKSPIFIKIIISIAVSAGVDTDIIIMRGISIAILTEILERNGYRVDISIVEGGQWDNNRYNINITLKHYNESPDLDRIVFFTAHPATLRRLIFSFLESRGEKFRKEFNCYENGTYGYPIESSIDKGDIYIGKALVSEEAWGSTKKAFKTIQGILKKKGIDLN